MFELKYYDEYNELMLCYISQQLRERHESPLQQTTLHIILTEDERSISVSLDVEPSQGNFKNIQSIYCVSGITQ